MRRIRRTFLNPDEFNHIDSSHIYPSATTAPKYNVKPCPVLAAIRDLIRTNGGTWQTKEAIEVLEDDGGSMAPLVYHRGFRHPTVTPNFTARCNEGEIIMNDYAVRRVEIVVDPGNQIAKVSGPDFNRWQDVNQYTTDTFAPRFRFSGSYYDPAYGLTRWFSNDNCVRINGQIRGPFWPFQFKRYAEVLKIGEPIDPRFNPDDVARGLDLITIYDIDHERVQKSLADANSGDLDILTELLELPQLIKSIMDGFKLIKKIFLDAKKKEFSIWKTVPSREQRLAKEAHKRYILKKLKKIPTFARWKKFPDNRHSTLEDYRIWRDIRTGAIHDYEKFLANSGGMYRKRALREVAEALSNLTLNTFYNIQPAIYTIQDTLELMDNWEEEYRRWGFGKTPTVTELRPFIPAIPEAEFVGVAKTEHRFLLKRRYFAKGFVTSVNSSLGMDVLVTAFELWRLWSIIFDWFFSISDMLRAIPWSATHSEEKACVNWKTVVDGSFTWQANGVDHRIDVSMEDFKRSTYNPTNSIGIYFKDTFGVKELMASMAFGFQSANGTLKKRYTIA